MTKLLEICILGFGSNEDGNVGVGVFPEREEILIGRLGFVGVALHGIGPADLEMRECTDWFVHDNSAMVEDFLELCCCFATLICSKIGFSAYINRVQIGPIVKANRWQAKFIRSSDPKNSKPLLRI